MKGISLESMDYISATCNKEDKVDNFIDDIIKLFKKHKLTITPIIISKNKIAEVANAYFKFTDISDDPDDVTKKFLFDVKQGLRKDYITNISLNFLKEK